MQFKPYLSGFILFAFLFLFLLSDITEARSGRRGGKGKGKSNLQFAQVAEFSLIQENVQDNRVCTLVILLGFRCWLNVFRMLKNFWNNS